MSGLSVGDYLITRLLDYGVRDIFGIPGDYVLAFYVMLEESPINTVGCTREDCAGFAADAYARVNNIGAVCVTYGVGGFSLANSIAGAYAEKSPVVLISGSPGLRERYHNPLLHHRVGKFRTQFDVFHCLCGATTQLHNPDTAFREIDRVLDAVVRKRRPGYIELPRDMVSVVPEGPHTPFVTEQKSDPDALAEALAEATRRLSQSRRPMILAGVEIHRLGLQEQLLALAEGAGIPITTTMLGKSVISETHPLFAGIYGSETGREDVSEMVEQSDCVVVLGAFLTDIDLAIDTVGLDPTKCIYATSETLRISHHHFHDVLLADFLTGLVDAGSKSPKAPRPPHPRAEEPDFQLRPDDPITIRRLIARVNVALDDSTVVIADVGDALFASMELVVHRQTEFLSPAYYASMGFAVPAALGTMVARPDLRPLVLVGDGAFQMTGMELSNIVRRNLSPIVIVLDNKGYGTERLLHAGDYQFNEIHPWQYHKLPQVLGGGTGYEVRTEGEFDRALRSAQADTTGMSLIQVHLDRNDKSQVLERLARNLGRNV
ncbi:MAG: preprotein translocase subunit Tim44 [Planctomycetes bacterium RBG_16_64_12]|nr:MAG: preprotein translocase subunit Tim44 [Planctomycetes bacterium RBG_16_64_12]